MLSDLFGGPLRAVRVPFVVESLAEEFHFSLELGQPLAMPGSVLCKHLKLSSKLLSSLVCDSDTSINAEADIFI